MRGDDATHVTVVAQFGVGAIRGLRSSCTPCATHSIGDPIPISMTRPYNLSIEARRELSERLRRLHADPEFAAKTAATASERMRD